MPEEDEERREVDVGGWTDRSFTLSSKRILGKGCRTWARERWLAAGSNIQMRQAEV